MHERNKAMSELQSWLDEGGAGPAPAGGDTTSQTDNPDANQTPAPDPAPDPATSQTPDQPQPQARVVTSLAVNPDTASIAVGNVQQFTAIAQLSDGSTDDITTVVALHWSSSDPSVVSIGENGLAEGKSVGNTLITATYEVSGITNSASIAVTAACDQTQPSDPGQNQAFDAGSKQPPDAG
jgi:uncharacterized protein YjdB